MALTTSQNADEPSPGADKCPAANGAMGDVAPDEARKTIDAQAQGDADHPAASMGGGGNVIGLSAAEIWDMTDGETALKIVGNGADRVVLTGDGSRHCWQQTGSHEGFNIYAWSDPDHAVMVEISQVLRQTAG
ncbi:MAG TPA: hypothetical protein VM639_00515 [Dongiaceae bacterium]|nr:hypothetical protein [Dongiaceae bacterium]